MDAGMPPQEPPALCGERVLLRQPILEQDVAARLEVPPDPELRRMYGQSGPPSPPTDASVREVLCAIAEHDRSKGRQFVIAALAWPDGRPVDQVDGRYVGHLRLTVFSWEDGNARVSIGIYDRRFWSRGYGTEALRLLLRHAFDDLRLHRVDLLVADYNARAIRAYEKCGFVREGVERETFRLDGVWHDDLLMSILEHEYRAQPWATLARPIAEP